MVFVVKIEPKHFGQVENCCTHFGWLDLKKCVLANSVLGTRSFLKTYTVLHLNILVLAPSLSSVRTSESD